MEAVSARAAARDRWNEMSFTPTQLQRYIVSACSPENLEPNLGMNLEIADLINSKKGSAPREGAIAIVAFVNHRNPHVCLLALNLLDICVKNCGYPFHLQISTKDFLNELVRRFPERPPIRPTRVQTKILEAIEEWRQTICETSRHKEDLGHIRDMHRLLLRKGYVFPEVRREDAAVLNPSDNLKSAEEMEKEEREAQSAKLQELIRRGSPQDLREANRLMKVMVGDSSQSRTDYRAKAAEEVAKIQAKARLLEERLEAFKPGDKMNEGDVFEELASALQSAHPKIQKMCEEESEDHEAVARLLEINDSIHRTVERYKLMKRGDVEGAKKLASGAPIPSSSAPAGEVSLIDFDADAGAVGGPSTSQQHSGVENDLLGLSLGESGGSSTYGQGGSITLGSGNAMPGTPSLLASLSQTSTGTGSPPAAPPSYSAFSSFTSPPGSQSITPQPSAQYAVGPPTALSSLSAIGSTDPFATLGALASSREPPPPPQPAAASSDDDEWAFSSALPDAQPALPKEHRDTVSNNDVKIEMQAFRTSSSPNAISMSFAFSNNKAIAVTELHFQLAVPKGYELKLKPQSGRTLLPNQSRGVTQGLEVWVTGNPGQKVESIKLRWKISYKVSGEQKNETGDISEFSIS